MKKYLILLAIFVCTGCSLLPRISFDTPGTTPQSEDKSSSKDICKGTLKIDTVTGVTTCSDGYYHQETTYQKKERSFTFKEKVINFFNGLVGWSFWLVVAACFLCPGLIGWIIGRVYNVFNKALTGTIRAINNFKSTIPTVTIDGKEVQDPAYVKAVDALLDQLETEHSADPAILKTISDIRLKLKIEDNA